MRVTNRHLCFRLFAVAAFSFLLLAGCSTSAPKQTRFMRESTGLTISADELRIKVRALAGRFSGLIVEAADRMMASTDDPEARRIVLHWKVHGIPAMQSALFQSDPLAAVIDAWAFIEQMKIFLTSELAAHFPEAVLTESLELVTRMEREIENLGHQITTPEGFERTRGRITAWAAEHPITGSIATRPTTAQELAEFTAETNPGLRQAVGVLTVGLEDVWARLDVYSAYLPKQARWEAELLIDDLMRGNDAGAALSDFGRITSSIDRIAETVETAPDLIAEEREAILAALHAERVAAFDTLGRELTRAFQLLSEERVDTIENSLRNERIATLSHLTAERELVLAAIREERVLAMQELDAIVGGLAEDALTRVVDHIFVRLLQLLAIVLIVGIAVVLLLRRFMVRGTAD
jgi:hypothetical protein